MKKLYIAIAVLAAAVVSASPLVHHKAQANRTKTAAPSTIQADYPVPVCPPYCALPTPTQPPQ